MFRPPQKGREEGTRAPATGYPRPIHICKACFANIHHLLFRPASFIEGESEGEGEGEGELGSGSEVTGAAASLPTACV